MAAGAGPGAAGQVTAAVLLYRAVTYLPPIPLGAAAYLIWQHAPRLLHSRPDNDGMAIPRGDDDTRQPATTDTAAIGIARAGDFPRG
jgi:hypothetical protein